MKKLLSLFIILAPVFAVAQETFKFKVVSATTGEPMAKKWFTILKNYDQFVEGQPTDSAGVCTFIIRRYDSTATYQAEIMNWGNNQVESGLYDITAIKTTVPTIKVKPAAYSLPYGCGTVMYSGYRPRVPYSMNDLPQNIREKVDSYLTARVGKAFYKTITLNGGQIINQQRLVAVNDRAKLNHYVPPAYSLCFTIMDSITHAGIYNFQLKLDSTGTLIEPVPLPDIKRHAERAKIMPLEQAKFFAAKEGFNKAWTDAKTNYHPKIQSIVWEFEQTEPGDGLKRSDTLVIDAYNGKIVERLSRYVSVMY